MERVVPSARLSRLSEPTAVIATPMAIVSGAASAGEEKYLPAVARPRASPASMGNCTEV
jgi:hypothetical protein